MRFYVLFIFLFILSCSGCTYGADWVNYFENNNEANELVIFNALNLDDSQRIEVKEQNRDLKHVVTRRQKPKYSMIKRLERQNKKRPRDSEKYYKTNSQLHQFGDPKIIEKSN